MSPLMAKKASARRRSLNRYRQPPVNATLDLETLDSLDVIGSELTPAAASKYRVLSVALTVGCVNLTAGEGPISIGYADGDYTDAEIEQYLEVVGGFTLGNRVEQEQANRIIRRIATIDSLEPMANDGQPIKTKLNWLVDIGKTTRFWAYNLGAQLTTGATVKIDGVANIVFQ